MQIAAALAGFSLGEADLLRKAMGKKKPEVMAEQKREVRGRRASARASRAERAEEIFEYIEPFAGYGFNKSHSVAYAMLAYQTAYLKAHYPRGLHGRHALLRDASTDDVVKYIQECREMGIEVLPPDVNQSHWPFTVVGERIRFGLGAIKGLGEGAAESILEARRRVGSFRSLASFALEVESKQINQKVFECLIRSGAFDALGAHRAALAAALERVLDDTARRRRERDEGQTTLFGGTVENEPGPDPRTPPWAEQERLRYEKEALGFYLTGNPLSRHEAQLERLVSHRTTQLRERVEGKVTVGGLVTRMRRTKIKSGPNAGRVMGHFVLEDLHGSLSVALFTDQLQRFEPLLHEEAMVLVKGMLRERGSECELIAEEVTPLERAAQRLIDAVEVLLHPELATAELLAIRDLLADHPGDVPVLLALDLPDGRVTIDPEERFRVRSTPALFAALERSWGPGESARSGCPALPS